MEKIVSKNNSKVKDAFKYKNQPGDYFLVEGFHLVEMAKEFECLIAVFSTKETSFKSVQSYLVTNEIIKKLASTKTPEGIVGLCKNLNNSFSFGDKVIFLDNVQDPGNVGTILRTALAFGFEDIILGKGCPSIYNSKLLMASQGSIFKLNCPKGDINTILDLKNKGYSIISTALKDSISFDSLELNESKKVFVFGNEGNGISDDILKISDYKVRIDMSNIDSLNVAIAAGIILNKFKKLEK